ncbi:MAG: cytochrome c oxidase assembly protein [bacterium]|nr:cytochrome c oxidase assembly protein [bacterium]
MPFVWARRSVGTRRWILVLSVLVVATAAFVPMLESPSSYVWEVVRVCYLVMVLPLAIVVVIPNAWLSGQRFLAMLRYVDHPLIAPLGLPIVLGAFFFTGVWAAVLGNSALYVLSYPALLAVGLLLHVGIPGISRVRTATVFAFLFLISMIELLLDAVPGIVMMLTSHVLNLSYWLSVSPVGTTIDALAGQQRVGGGLLLLVAELMDLPVLAVIVARWVQADAREAQQIDAFLDAQELHAGPLPWGPATDRD